MKNFFISIFIVLLITFLSPSRSQAQLGFYFGGPIVMTITCGCSGNSLVYILDYSSMSIKALVYEPGYSQLYMNYNIETPSVNTLGSYDPVGICVVTAYPCSSWPSNGMINNRPGVGTSMF